MAIRVLVADDEPAIPSLMADILAHAGYEVLQAMDGEEALALAREARPAIILLDVTMPGLDGRVACRILKHDPALAGVPVLLFSSADESDVDWREAGADAFLQKPFEIRALPALVARLLGAVGA